MRGARGSGRTLTVSVPLGFVDLSPSIRAVLLSFARGDKNREYRVGCCALEIFGRPHRFFRAQIARLHPARVHNSHAGRAAQRQALLGSATRRGILSGAHKWTQVELVTTSSRVRTRLWQKVARVPAG